MFLNEVLIFFVICVSTWLWRRSRRPQGYPPGPLPLPLIGNFYNIKNGDMIESARNFRREYGDVFSLAFGEFWVIFVNGAENIRSIMKKNSDKMLDRPPIYAMKIIDNKGLISSNGKVWKEQRAFALKKMRNFGFGKRDFETQITEEVEQFLEFIEAYNGQPFDLSEGINMSISNNILSIITGHRYKYEDEKFKYLINLLAENFRSIEMTGVLSFCPSIFTNIPMPGISLKKLLEPVQFYKECVDEHKKTFDDVTTRDFIDAFLKEIKHHTEDEDTTFTEDQLVHVVGDMFTAGTETTSSTIRWAVLYLLHYPQVKDKMFEEIKKVVGLSRFPNLSDKPNLPFCEAVILESLRLGNIVPFAVPYHVTDEFSFNGHIFPKNAIVFLSLDSVLSCEETFENSQTFNPDRFIDEEGNLYGKEKVMAFSTGRRSCLGEALARMELFLYLTAMVQRFEFKPVDENNLPPLKGHLGITRTPNPFQCKVVHRN